MNKSKPMYMYANKKKNIKISYIHQFIIFDTEGIMIRMANYIRNPH